MMSILLNLVACNPVGGSDTGPGDGPAPGEACVSAAPVVINEVSPSNVSVLLDEDGDSVDWVELTNHGGAPVDLAGWSLSDDDDEPAKWSFPPYTLDPGAFVVVLASGKDRATIVGTWDTRIDQGDTWRYLEVVSPPDPDWIRPEFDDSGWASGPSGFGNGDLDDATEVAADTVYVRTELALTASELTDLRAMLLHVDYDDAFVAYLNGVEVARAGIGFAGDRPAWDALANVVHEAQMFEGGRPTAFDLRGSLEVLTEGSNTLAIEIHDGTADSTDLTLVPFLSLGFGSEREGRTSEAVPLSTAQLHTNFSLKASGERVRLYDPVGCVAGDVEPMQLLADMSYGRQPDGTGELGYFLEPTPGAANTTESRPGFAVTPRFDPPPGAAGGPVSVVSTPGAEVHVAMDGWEPTEADPTYATPLPVDGSREAVVIRARAWEDGLWPSRIATGTWVTSPPADLPIVSLVTDPPNLWDDQIGIYALGLDHDPDPPYLGANYYESWDRPVHMAEWEPDGTLGFAVDASVAIHGGYSRIHEQKSLLVELGSGYGEDSFEHDLFPGLELDEFDRVLLRAAGNDWYGCFEQGCVTGAHLRDGLMHRIAEGQDLDVLAWRPTHVYLNGEYWGVYHLNERTDASYVRDHHGEEDIDLLEGNAQPVRGDELAWHSMMEWLRTHDLSTSDGWAEVQELVDVDEYATYMAFEIYYDNQDWPGNNVKVWRPRAEGGRWRWMLYDTDFGLGLYGESPTNDSLARALDGGGPLWPNPPWSTELFRLMMTSPDFRDLFVNRYADLMNTHLTPARTRALLAEVQAEIAPGMPMQAERWGHWSEGATELSIPAGAWEDEVWWIHSWLGERPDFAREHLVANLGLAGVWTLGLDSDPPGAGTFRLTAVEVDAPFTGVYFEGVPVTITAVPAAGRSFVGWSDPGLPSTPTITVDSSGRMDLVARFE